MPNFNREDLIGDMYHLIRKEGRQKAPVEPLHRDDELLIYLALGIGRGPVMEQFLAGDITLCAGGFVRVERLRWPPE